MARTNVPTRRSARVSNSNDSGTPEETPSSTAPDAQPRLLDQHVDLMGNQDSETMDQVFSVIPNTQTQPLSQFVTDNPAAIRGQSDVHPDRAHQVSGANPDAGQGTRRAARAATPPLSEEDLLDKAIEQLRRSDRIMQKRKFKEILEGRAARGEPLIQENEDDYGNPIAKKPRDTSSSFVRLTLKIPMYNGERDWQVLSNWTAIVEEYFDLNPQDFPTDHHRLVLGELNTKPAVVANWRHFQKNQNLPKTWEAYKRHLQTRIKAAEQRNQDVIDGFFNGTFKQRAGQAFLDVYEEFNKQMGELDTQIPERIQTCFLLAVLLTEYRNAVTQPVWPLSLEELSKRAIAFESIQQAKNPPPAPQPSSQRNPPSFPSSHPPHQPTPAPQPPRGGPPGNKPPNACFLCKEPGHISWLCPKAICRTCGKMGHQYQKCPELPSNPNTNPNAIPLRQSGIPNPP